MTDPLITDRQRQAAADGPSLALRNQRRAAMTGLAERRPQQQPPLPAGQYGPADESRAAAALRLRAMRLRLLELDTT